MKFASLKKIIQRSIKRARVPFQIIFCILFTFHISASIFENIPKRGPVSQKVSAFTSKYLNMAGAVQGWRMFISAPLVHSYKIKVVLKDKEGHRLTLPPMLPGFKESGTHFKEELFFIRSSYKQKWYLDQYLKKVCTAASHAYNKEFDSVKLVMGKDYLQNLTSARKDNIFRKYQEYTYGRTSCHP